MKTSRAKRVFCSVMAAALLAFGPAATALAAGTAPSLTLSEARLLTLSPEGAESQNPDLFQNNTKGMMPGDTTTLTVKLVNNYSDHMDIYLRAEDTALQSFDGSEEAKALSDTLLAQIKLTVAKSSGEILYEGSADGKSAAAGQALNRIDDGYVLIGRINGKQESYLTVTVEVPTSLGNEYQNRLAQVDWIFYATGDDPTPPTPDKPDRPDHDPGPSPWYDRDKDNTTDIPETEVPLAPPTLDIEDGEVPLASPDSLIVVDIPEGNLPLTGATGFHAMEGNTVAVGCTVLVLFTACVVLAVANHKRLAKKK